MAHLNNKNALSEQDFRMRVAALSAAILNDDIVIDIVDVVDLSHVGEVVDLTVSEAADS